jgi:hypothetical protein
LSGRCSGITRSGTRCERSVEGPNGMCWLHDPTRSEERRRAASKVGKAKPNREIAGIKARLSELAEDVLAGEVDRANAAVAGQLLNTVIRAVSVELKVREQMDLIERLEELEILMRHQREQRHRGA